ncbi:hypothetical protein EV127DRAFT_105173 [Xylaria flabelliformis]|nr:hypothetical protein EV127DRAFT_105173 [Xylaria flabelliformis]
MTAQFENSKTPPPESPTTCSITYVEAVPSQDGKLLRSQKPARSRSRQPLIETPTESFTDSGYASLSTTPSEKSLDRSESIPRSPIISLLFSKKKKVFFSDKPTDQPTRDRFRAIQPSFEKLLLEEIRGHQKPGTRYKPISTRLAMMGVSENDAQPHIAIFCQPEQKRLIQAFVKKDIVVDIYRPKGPSAPAFEVVVFGNAPRLRFSKSNTEVVTDARYLLATPETLCGIPISFQDPTGQRRNATFGGLIKVVTANGSIELLGMTAGHLVHQWDHDSDEDMLDAINSQNALPASPSAFEDDDGSFVDDITDINETNEDEFNEYELDFVPFGELPGALIEDRTGLWDFRNLTILGELIDISKDDTICSNGRYYDWAIFQPVPYRMNLVPANPKAELRICDKRPGAIESQPVIVLSSSTGCTAGTISSEPGRLLLGGEEFIDAFMLTMSEGQGILDGNSGSWVVDATHFEVYGQLVASDVFGSGYVIPMTDILSDVKLRLGAQSVELPSLVDILQASAKDMDGRLATSGQDQNGLQTMSARIGSRSPTPTLDHHSGIAILNPSYIPFGGLDSGYSSLNPSPDTSIIGKHYLSRTRFGKDYY